MWITIGLISLIIILAFGIRIVRPTDKILIETLGKYTKTKDAGFTWIIPIIQNAVYVNITEQMVDIQPQSVITKDNLNAVVDAVVYYQIRDVKAAEYNVDDHEIQLTSLARTTLRAVIGKMTFTEANEERDKINERVEKILDKETNSYGVEVLRVEIQRIQPPQAVQEAMNDVVVAERKKISAKDFANAVEIEADGKRRAEIKKADGVKQARIMEAEGKAQAIKLENEAAHKYFVGNAQLLKQLEVTVDSLRNNSKVIVPNDSELVNIIGDLSGSPIFKKINK